MKRPPDDGSTARTRHAAFAACFVDDLFERHVSPHSGILSSRKTPESSSLRIDLPRAWEVAALSTARRRPRRAVWGTLEIHGRRQHKLTDRSDLIEDAVLRVLFPQLALSSWSTWRLVYVDLTSPDVFEAFLALLTSRVSLRALRFHGCKLLPSQALRLVQVLTDCNSELKVLEFISARPTRDFARTLLHALGTVRDAALLHARLEELVLDVHNGGGERDAAFSRSFLGRSEPSFLRVLRLEEIYEMNEAHALVPASPAVRELGLPLLRLASRHGGGENGTHFQNIKRLLRRVQELGTLERLALNGFLIEEEEEEEASEEAASEPLGLLPSLEQLELREVDFRGDDEDGVLGRRKLELIRLCLGGASRLTTLKLVDPVFPADARGEAMGVLRRVLHGLESLTVDASQGAYSEARVEPPWLPSLLEALRPSPKGVTSRLTSLRLENGSLRHPDLSALMAALSRSSAGSSLQSLSLKGNKLELEQVVGDWIASKSSHGLESLCVASNQLFTGHEFLARCSRHPTLVSLDMKDTDVGWLPARRREGKPARRGARRGSRLRYVDLREAPHSDALMRVLRSISSTLRVVDLRSGHRRHREPDHLRVLAGALSGHRPGGAELRCFLSPWDEPKLQPALALGRSRSAMLAFCVGIRKHPRSFRAWGDACGGDGEDWLKRAVLDLLVELNGHWPAAAYDEYLPLEQQLQEQGAQEL